MGGQNWQIFTCYLLTECNDLLFSQHNAFWAYPKVIECVYLLLYVASFQFQSPPAMSPRPSVPWSRLVWLRMWHQFQLPQRSNLSHTVWSHSAIFKSVCSVCTLSTLCCILLSGDEHVLFWDFYCNVKLTNNYSIVTIFLRYCYCQLRCVIVMLFLCKRR